jgi:hypothetical protein
MCLVAFGVYTVMKVLCFVSMYKSKVQILKLGGYPPKIILSLLSHQAVFSRCVKLHLVCTVLRKFYVLFQCNKINVQSLRLNRSPPKIILSLLSHRAVFLRHVLLHWVCTMFSKFYVLFQCTKAKCKASNLVDIPPKSYCLCFLIGPCF